MTTTEILSFGAKEAATVHELLKSSQNSADFRKITIALEKRVDEIFLDRLQSSGQTVACRAGCSFCCHIKVDAQPHEIFRLVEFIKNRFSESEIEEIKKRAEANQKRIVGMTAEQQMKTNIPCSLLRDGKCICYEARPVMCRKHHAQDVSRCEAVFHKPDAEVGADEIPLVQLTLAAVIVMTQRAFEIEGYDSRAYDLSSTLAEALSNPKCERRWRDKKSAFAKSSLAKEPVQESTPIETFQLPQMRSAQ